MGPSGQQPPEQLRSPQPGGESVRLEAHASGQARIHQAARDLHLHYHDGVRGTRRVEPGTGAGECPYPGLASFGREQAPWFFGRDQLTTELTARLDERLRTGGVQVVVAPSGAGKSSLLHAGLLPQLAHGALPGSSQWPTVVLTPTAHPLAALATHLAALTGADPAALTQKLAAHSPSAGRVLSQALRKCLDAENPQARVVVIVDQFEELFTLCPDDRLGSSCGWRGTDWPPGAGKARGCSTDGQPGSEGETAQEVPGEPSGSRVRGASSAGHSVRSS